MAKSRDDLRQKGFVVPASAGQKNHYNVPLFALADDDRGVLRLTHGLSTQERVRGFRESLLATLKADAASWADDDTVILSSEHLIHLQSPEEFGRLKEVLATMGPRPVRIVIYLRRQDAYYASAYAQHVRGGSTATWMSTESFDHLVLDYRVLLDRWEGAFGRESISVRVFERGQLTANDAVADFMSFVGCPLAGTVNVERNVSLGARETEFLRRLNPRFPRFVDGQLNEQRRSLVQALTGISSGPPLRLDSKRALEILARYRDSNAAIAAKYLGRTDGQLFYEMPDDAPEQPPTLSVDEAVELSARLWAFAHQRDPKPTGENRKAKKAERMAGMTLEQRRALRRARQARGRAT